MAHAFMLLGVPRYVLTDNMRSVVTGRDPEGRPVWQADYASFMSCVGFKTRLCKPRHPFTKGKVERLVRFVKENFLAGRSFRDITELNEQALAWCADQSSRYRRASDLVPADEHGSRRLPAAGGVSLEGELALYLRPRRRVSFDGFVSFEGRRFGVPYWYAGSACRVRREGGLVRIYSDDLSRELASHRVTWSRRDSLCEGQYADDPLAAAQPCESPSAPVTAMVRRLEPPSPRRGFDRFDFGGAQR